MPLKPMLYLYLLLVLSLAALLWAVWAITKHVRKHSGEERTHDSIEPEVDRHARPINTARLQIEADILKMQELQLSGKDREDASKGSAR